jgi:diguanylate cyclase (GGDEF)-like protein
MNLHIARLPRLLAERRSTAVLGLVIIAMLWAVIVVKYAGDIQADRLAAQRMTQNFTMVFEENVLRSIGEIDKALLYMRRTIETRKDTSDYGTIVHTTDVLSEIIVQVAIIDQNGIMRASNAGPQPAPPIDLGDREHFRFHVNRDADELFISKPLVGRASGKWSVQFTRRFLNRDGSFAGVVVASLDPAHLTEFYNKIDLGADVGISLVGADGIVRATGGSADGYSLGFDLSGREIARRMATSANASFEDADPSSGQTRIITIRKVRGHPLWVSVSTSEQDAFADSWAAFKINTIIGLALTLIILGAMERVLRSEERARLKADQLRLTLEHMRQGIMLVTRDREIPVINRRCAELLSLPDDVVQHPPRFDQLVASACHRGALTDPQDLRSGPVAADSATEPGGSLVYERWGPNGRMLEVRAGSLPDGSFVQTFTDITKRWEAEARVARLASEDPLTGLPNRRVFRTDLDRQCDTLATSCPPADGEISFAVFFLDLDRFKVINDSMGHRMGDRLLQAVAQRLLTTLVDGDTLARLGGDEFAIIVKSARSRPALDARAAAIVEAIARPYEIDGSRVRSSVSIGVAVAPVDGRTADDLLVAADVALYEVKANHRGSHRFFEQAMTLEVNERRQIELDLREAIEANAIELHYQPIVDMRTGAVTGFEALARWNHPVRGAIPPTVFIPIAEDTGIIYTLGRWILIEACRQAMTWPDCMAVSVNVSPVQFAEPDFVETVAAALAAAGLDPARLELELTEGIFLEDNAATSTTLRKLKDLGVAITLDDFGTGYASLSYLRVFPFDRIKIDRSFVSDLGTGSQLIAIVQAVVSIARALGMTTTAEGVETEAQREFLAALGCDHAQGWLFSRALPPAEVIKLLDGAPSSSTMAA